MATLIGTQLKNGAPRVCGDDPQCYLTPAELQLCSPRMRG